MDGLEAFLAVVIVCVNDDERSFNYVLRCKHGLTGSPRLRPTFRQSSRNIVEILESIDVSAFRQRQGFSLQKTVHHFFEIEDLLSKEKMKPGCDLFCCVSHRFKAVRQSFRIKITGKMRGHDQIGRSLIP